MSVDKVNALGFATTLVYDGVGQQTVVQDARGNSTLSVYDARGNVIATIDPLGRRTSYAYDAVDNQILRMDARGIATTYSYDHRDLLIGMQYPDGGCVTNAYDAIGRPAMMADSTGITTYSYDGDNRQSSMAYPIGKVLSYSYDSVGNRTQMQLDGNITSYSYDPNSNLTQIINPYSETTTFSYDALNREEHKTLANGVTINHTYDAAGREVLLEQRKADTTALAIYTATYDAVGICTMTQELDGSTNSYSYDATYQLLNETRGGTNAFSTTFTYDPTGNWLAQNADGSLTTSTYDAANQIVTAVTNDEVTTFTSDANGNLITEDTNGVLTTYTWDAENRMIGAAEGTNTETFIYAGNGQRSSKSTFSVDIHYLWDGENILEELDGSNALIAHYTDFPGYWGGLISERLAGDESEFYLFDLQSSNRLLLDASATTSNEYLYKAFGEKVLSTGIVRNPFQFQGQVGPYFDAINRTWMRARIYNSITGRWDSSDPIGFDGADWNLYRFAGNNPAEYTDPSGLSDADDPRNLSMSERMRRNNAELLLKRAHSCILRSLDYCESAEQKGYKNRAANGFCYVSTQLCTKAIDSPLFSSIPFYSTDTRRHLDCLSRCMHRHWQLHDTHRWKEAERTCSQYGQGCNKCCKATIAGEQDGLTQCDKTCRGRYKHGNIFPPLTWNTPWTANFPFNDKSTVVRAQAGIDLVCGKGYAGSKESALQAYNVVRANLGF